MKNFLNKLNEFQKSIFFSLVISGILLFLSSIGFFFLQPGWFIGVCLGAIVEIINILLLYKGSSYILDSKKSFLFLLFFFLRMILAASIFILCLIFDLKLNIATFHNSIWGAVIALGPSEIIALLLMVKSTKTIEVK